ncbi:cytochrome c biogenesis protein CcdA [Selenomonas sp. TAMA-11512]|uniref:cytochrome c biogenesis CcdA family protein n=1 Tax=Selenomonas sp. TAMA-11512 TaxID=3095337 RepID=UPI0030907FCA|nr:cytochrome c biogenesis protein CcdA [Selenomonas sp. TAMA-11512]
MTDFTFFTAPDTLLGAPLALALGAAVLAGALSFFSPCVLPMLPTYFLLLTQKNGSASSSFPSRIHLPGERPTKTGSFYPNVLAFLLGFSAVFCLLGASAAMLGDFLMMYADILQKAAAVLLVLFALFLSGVWQPAFLYREVRPLLGIQVKGTLSAFLFGAAFSIGWTPCTGPMLSLILLLAGTSATLSTGALLLVFYALGFAVPFLLLAVLYRRLEMHFQRLYRCMPVLQKLAALLLLIFAVLLWQGNTLWLAGFLLQ